MPSKTCRKCGEEKPVPEGFYKHSATTTGLSSHCRECKKATAVEWNRNNKEAHHARTRRSYLRRKFNITPEEYEEMLLAQDGLCAICAGVDPNGRLAVDHCHRTGKVRALLCRRCNTAIGALDDDPQLLLLAYAYLKITESE